jgi:hypothetical protein
MKREYTTVTLTARVDGECVILLDVHGKKIAVLPARDAITSDVKTISSIELRHQWKHAFSGMMGSLNNRQRRFAQSPWQSKFGVWTTSLRWRRNRKRPQFKQRSKKYSQASRPDWASAVSCLMSQYNGRLHEHRLRTTNPWRLWAQTVAGNHRKKGTMHADRSIQKKANSVGDCETTGKEIAGSTIQVCINWGGNDSNAVVA